MPDKDVPNSEEKVDKKLVKEEPGLTIPPPQLTLQQEPIPNPDLSSKTEKK